jgi:hypothetical protein
VRAATAIVQLVLLVASAEGLLAQPLPTFAGQQVSVTAGQVGRGISASLSPARVCLAPSGICFTAPNHTPPFGLTPTVAVVQLNASQQALSFTAIASGGGSGSSKMLSLLVLRDGRLESLSTGVTISEQGEFAIWQEPSLSSFALVVTADYIWGASETHFSPHRYRVSAYVMGALAGGGELRQYFLQDEYMTSTKYPSLDQAGRVAVLDRERPEVLTRLRRQR